MSFIIACVMRHQFFNQTLTYQGNILWIQHYSWSVSRSHEIFITLRDDCQRDGRTPELQRVSPGSFGWNICRVYNFLGCVSQLNYWDQKSGITFCRLVGWSVETFGDPFGALSSGIVVETKNSRGTEWLSTIVNMVGRHHARQRRNNFFLSAHISVVLRWKVVLE